MKSLCGERLCLTYFSCPKQCLAPYNLVNKQSAIQHCLHYLEIDMQRNSFAFQIRLNIVYKVGNRVQSLTMSDECGQGIYPQGASVPHL